MRCEGTDRAARASADLLEAPPLLRTRGRTARRMPHCNGQAERWREERRTASATTSTTASVSYSTKPDLRLIDRIEPCPPLPLVRITSPRCVLHVKMSQLLNSDCLREMRRFLLIDSIDMAIDTASLPTAPTATATAGVSLFSANELA